MLAGVIMIVANIFDFIDGKVAHITGKQSAVRRLLGLDARPLLGPRAVHRPDLALRDAAAGTDYVLVATLALIFSIMTSYARARAESLIDKCKVGFMERPERIVLFMIGAFTNRMAARAVGDPGAVDRHGRQPHLLHLPGAQQAADAVDRRPAAARSGAFFFWRDERATLPYDIWVIAILAFVWLTPPDWLNDPTASGMGLLGYFVQ